MDTDALYATFTHPKVVTSMLLIGIGLGLVLSALVYLFWGQWFLPVAFAAVALGVVILYMVWLDRQKFPRETGPAAPPLPGRGENENTVLVRPDRPAGMKDTPSGYAIFTSPRVIGSMVLLGLGLGLALCVLIILFHGAWFLPALVAALTMGTAAGYLCWLDGQQLREE